MIVTEDDRKSEISESTNDITSYIVDVSIVSPVIISEEPMEKIEDDTSESVNNPIRTTESVNSKVEDDFFFYQQYYDYRTKRFEDVRMEESWQRYVYYKCEQYNVDFPTVMAILGTESGWDTYATVSKNGIYYGAGMIHIKYSEAYLSTHGITLRTTAGSLEAVCFVLHEKIERFNDVNKAIIAYNRGNGGAEKLFASGVYTSSYLERVNSIKKGLLKYKEMVEETEKGKILWQKKRKASSQPFKPLT